MEIQLQELIDKIRKEGIDSVQAEVAEIKANAEKESTLLVEQAKLQAKKILDQANEEAARHEKASLANLEQAARNVLLSFKSEVQVLLDKIILASVHSTYSEDIIKSILPDILRNWGEKNTEDLELLVSEKQLTLLDEAFKSLLASTLKAGVEIKTVSNLDSGFRIVEKDGAAYYDFSGEAVANLLSSYLNPRLASILKNVEK